MRVYTLNSPEAAARVLALTLLADSQICKPRLAQLDAIGAPAQLGLNREQMQAVLQGLCEDLLLAPHMDWQGSRHIDERSLSEAMGDVCDPGLRLKVLRLALALAEADGHVSDDESWILNAAVEHWGLHAEMLRRPPPFMPLPTGLAASPGARQRAA